MGKNEKILKKKVPVSEKKISAPILKLDLGSQYRNLVSVTHYFRVSNLVRLFEDRTIHRDLDQMELKMISLTLLKVEKWSFYYITVHNFGVP